MINRLIRRIFLFSLLIGILQVEIDLEGIYCANNVFAQSQRGQLQNLNSYLNNNPPIEIIRSEPHFLILRFRLTHLEMELVKTQTHQLNGQSATRIQFDGSSWTTDSGKPKLPNYSVQIGLPSTSSVTTTIIDKQSSFKNTCNAATHKPRN